MTTAKRFKIELTRANSLTTPMGLRMQKGKEYFCIEGSREHVYFQGNSDFDVSEVSEVRIPTAPTNRRLTRAQKKQLEQSNAQKRAMVEVEKKVKEATQTAPKDDDLEDDLEDEDGDDFEDEDGDEEDEDGDEDGDEEGEDEDEEGEDEDEEGEDEDELSLMVKRELVELAKELKIDFKASASKTELIREIEKARSK
jgi:hypothetical protein